jgi:hypothetical protein
VTTLANIRNSVLTFHQLEQGTALTSYMALVDLCVNECIAMRQRQHEINLNVTKANNLVINPTGEVVLPSDFLMLCQNRDNPVIWVNGTIQVQLKQCNDVDFDSIKYSYINTSVYGNPTIYIFRNNTLEVFPVPSTGTISLYHIKSYASLVGDAATNDWLNKAEYLVVNDATARLFIVREFKDQAMTYMEKADAFAAMLEKQYNQTEFTGYVSTRTAL